MKRASRHRSPPVDNAAAPRARLRRGGDPSAAPARRAPLPGLLPAAAVALLALAVYAPVLGHDFLTWDDMMAVSENAAFTPPTRASLAAYWTEIRPTTQFYVPVMHTIWWVLAALTGRWAPGGRYVLPPGPFHAANWVAHAVAAALAYAVIQRLVRNRAAAWVGAAVFAVHPIQVEAVSWASTFYTPMSTACALAALWLFGRYLDLRFDAPDEPSADAEGAGRAGRRRRAWWALAGGTLCLLAGLLTKPAIVLTPVIAVLLEAGLRRRPWRQVVPAAAAWLLVCVPVMLVAKATQPPPTPYLPLWQRPFVAADALTFYLTKVLLPLQFATDYGRSPKWLVENGAWRYTWVAPVAVAAGLLLAAVRRRTAWPVVCAAVFVAAAAPTLGLVWFDYQSYSTVADRYVYFAMFAVGLAAAGAMTLVRPTGATRVYAAAGVVLAVLAVRAHVQTYHWRDTATLFRHTSEVNPDSLLSTLSVAEDALRRGDGATAEEYFRAAVEAHPDNRVAIGRFADFALRINRFPEAAAFYERALEFPGPPPAKLLTNYGIALAQSPGRMPDAMRAFERALSIDPDHFETHLSLGVLMFGQKDYARARLHFEKALRLKPTSPEARDGLTQLERIGQ